MRRSFAHILWILVFCVPVRAHQPPETETRPLGEEKLVDVEQDIKKYRDSIIEQMPAGDCRPELTKLEVSDRLDALLKEAKERKLDRVAVRNAMQTINGLVTSRLVPSRFNNLGNEVFDSQADVSRALDLFEAKTIVPLIHLPCNASWRATFDIELLKDTRNGSHRTFKEIAAEASRLSKTAMLSIAYLARIHPPHAKQAVDEKLPTLSRVQQRRMAALIGDTEAGKLTPQQIVDFGRNTERTFGEKEVSHVLVGLNWIEQNISIDAAKHAFSISELRDSSHPLFPVMMDHSAGKTTDQIIPHLGKFEELGDELATLRYMSTNGHLGKLTSGILRHLNSEIERQRFLPLADAKLYQRWAADPDNLVFDEKTPKTTKDKLFQNFSRLRTACEALQKTREFKERWVDNRLKRESHYDIKRYEEFMLVAQETTTLAPDFNPFARSKDGANAHDVWTDTPNDRCGRLYNSIGDLPTRSLEYHLVKGFDWNNSDFEREASLVYLKNDRNAQRAIVLAKHLRWALPRAIRLVEPIRTATSQKQRLIEIEKYNARAIAEIPAELLLPLGEKLARELDRGGRSGDLQTKAEINQVLDLIAQAKQARSFPGIKGIFATELRKLDLEMKPLFAKYSRGEGSYEKASQFLELDAIGEGKMFPSFGFDSKKSLVEKYRQDLRQTSVGRIDGLEIREMGYVRSYNKW